MDRTGSIKIALFVDPRGGDWHARRLARAFEARGVTVAVACLQHCAFDTASPSGLTIPGLPPGDLPNAAFVRSIGDGSLEQITFRLGILHALEASGVRVWNGPRAIERSVDKSTATFLFQGAGLPVPSTITTEGRKRAAEALKRLGMPAVSKPMFGAQGVGIDRMDATCELPPPENVGEVYYLQSLIVPGAHATSLRNGTRVSGAATCYEDFRVLVSAGRVLAAMARRSDYWVTNVHQGGAPVAVKPDAEMTDLALRAAAAVGADYGGVDLICGADGRLLVLEVNSNPAWRGLQSVTDVDIADTLAADLLRAVGFGASAVGPSATARAAGQATAPGGSRE